MSLAVADRGHVDSHSSAAPWMKLRTNTSRSAHLYRKAEAGKRPVQQLQNENQSKPIVTTTTVCSDLGPRLSGSVSKIYRPHIRSDEHSPRTNNSSHERWAFIAKRTACLLCIDRRTTDAVIGVTDTSRLQSVAQIRLMTISVWNVRLKQEQSETAYVRQGDGLDPECGSGYGLWIRITS